MEIVKGDTVRHPSTKLRILTVETVMGDEAVCVGSRKGKTERYTLKLAELTKVQRGLAVLVTRR